MQAGEESSDNWSAFSLELTVRWGAWLKGGVSLRELNNALLVRIKVNSVFF